jgi:elongation factor Ts
VPDHIGSYIHHDGTVAVLVRLRTHDGWSGRTDEFKALAHDLAVHIAGLSPHCISRQDLDLAVWNKHLNAYRMELADLAPGERDAKVQEPRARFERERFLLSQPFCKDPSKTVGEHIAAVAHALGDTIRVVEFTRYDVRET